MPAPLRLALPTRLFDAPLREKIRLAGVAGVRGVQFDLRHELRAEELSATGRRELAHLLSERDLQPAPALFPLRRPLADEQGVEERVAALAAALRFAASLRVRALVLRPGPLPAAQSPAGRLLAEVLSDVARAGDHVGVVPVLATGRDDPADLRALLAGIGSGPMGAELDVGGLAMAGRDPAAAARTLHPFVSHVRARDGLRESDGAGVEVTVGRGEVEWEEVLATLVEIEYAGFITADRTAGSDPAGDAINAVSYLRNVMPF